MFITPADAPIRGALVAGRLATGVAVVESVAFHTCALALWAHGRPGAHQQWRIPGEPPAAARAAVWLKFGPSVPETKPAAPWSVEAGVAGFSSWSSMILVVGRCPG